MSNFLAQSNYITTQIQLPLNLEVTFKVTDEVITFNDLVKDIDFNKFFFKKDIYNTETRGRKQKSRANILKAPPDRSMYLLILYNNLYSISSLA